MTTSFIPVRVDMRGSINIPSGIKESLHINLGSTILVRQINGVIILAPLHGEAERASLEDRLHEWVGEQLDKPMTAAPIQASKMAVAESIRLQIIRERFEQKKQLLELELRLAEQKNQNREDNTLAQRAARAPVAGNVMEEAAAALRQSRAAEGDSLLAATLREAETPTLPQANQE